MFLRKIALEDWLPRQWSISMIMLEGNLCQKETDYGSKNKVEFCHQLPLICSPIRMLEL